MSAVKEQTVTREADKQARPSDNQKDVIPADDLPLIEVLVDIIFDQIVDAEKES